MLIFFLVQISFAQQEKLSDNNLLIKNRFLYNPANMGDTYKSSAFMNYRNRFTGIKDAPETQNFGISSAIGEKTNLGAIFTNDKRGAIENIEAKLFYSYNVKFSDRNKIAFGIGGGFQKVSLNNSKIIADNEDDILLIDNDFENSKFTSNAGLRYNFIDSSGRNLEIGFAMPNVANMRFNFLASYNMPFSKLDVQPYFAYRMMESTALKSFQFDAGLTLEWNKKFWAGFTYKSNSSYVILLGLNAKQISIAYAYEIGSEDIAKVSDGTHEVQLIYNFSLFDRNNPPDDEENEIDPLISKKVKNLDNKMDSIKNDLEKKIKNKQNSNGNSTIDNDKVNSLINELKKRDKQLSDSINSLLRKLNNLKFGKEDSRPYEKLDKNRMTDFSGEDIVNQDGSNLEHGIYVVIHSFRTKKMAERAVILMKEIGISCEISLNKRRSWYYVYTGVYRDRKIAISKMYLERNQHNIEDAWIYFY